MRAVCIPHGTRAFARRVSSHCLVLVLGLGLTLTLPLHADGLGKTWAIVVGIDKFQDANIPTLHYACSDAKSVRDFLTQTDAIGPDLSRLTLLTSDGSADMAPTRVNILNTLKKVAAQSAEGDAVWFYFSGHGFDKDGLSYLLPADFTLKDMVHSSLSVKEIRDILAGAKADRRVLILDACHSGSSRDPSQGASYAKLRELLSARGMVTLAACKLDESAIEFGPLPPNYQGGGAFTYFLGKALTGDADSAHRNLVTWKELKTYLDANVNTMVERTAPGYEQHPQVIPAQGDQDFALTVTNPALLAKLSEVTPDAHKGKVREPLGPAVIVDIPERRVANDQPIIGVGIAQAEIKKAFLDKSFLMVDREAARRVRTQDDFQTAARDVAADQPGGANPDGAKLIKEKGARYLLSGVAEASTQEFVRPAGKLYIARATITAQLTDEAGVILAVVNVDNAKDMASLQNSMGITEADASAKALRIAAASLVAQISAKIAEVLKRPNP